ncbi:PHP domain-containing protein [Roseburia sp. 499]|uniref:PHP domain-containing protein n=1 Tax=Roseburia sp. 499 TaxID=1261634 RepID=UPI0009517651|nr:PHP domain-containing protein [Roseburia sp. 499]WVK71264.1 PHP domain-containing protein [Roseburia sp. 499]
MIDLHTHSTESDGTLTPQELMHLAADTSLSAIALTDHDTIGGLAKAKPIAENLGIELIPGIELSTDYNGTEVHMLGFYIDDTNPAFLAKLQEFIQSRDIRNEKMAFLLQKEGFDITLEALYKEYPESVITRAHFARYLVEHGFVKDRDTVFRKYLGDNCRCYVPREKISPFEAIDLIRLGGGLSFFAHPVLCHMNHDRLRFFVKSLKESGLTGMEAIYSMNTPGDERNMKKLAAEFDLLISGGSDFHGENKPYLHLGTGKGNLKIPDNILDAIKAKRVSH